MTPTQLLHFEHQHPGATPAKRERIRNELGITETRYWQLLERAAHDADGIAAHPITARMIRERVQARAAIRVRRTAA